MNRYLPCFVAVALIIAGGLPVMAQSRGQEVAIVVNSEEIFTWELALLLPQIQAGMKDQGLEAKGEALIKSVMQRSIDNKLLQQEARRRGIERNNARIDQKMAKMSEEAGGRAKLEADLIKSGITYEQLRSTVVQADTVQSLVETEVGDGGEVTEEEILEFYNGNPELFKGPDKIHTRHILFKLPADATQDEKSTARDRADEARTRAVAGEDFSALAKELSEGPNAENGGDLGFTARGQMVASFDEVVWSLDAGEISDVVESYMGYHVVKVEEIAPGPVVPLDEARPLIQDLLRQQRISEALGQLVAGLRASAKIGEPEE